jgi:hypothetical protein
LRQYINTPIVLYDELVIICGDDDASGSFARDHYDTPHVETARSGTADDDLTWPDVQTDNPFSDTQAETQANTSQAGEPSQTYTAKSKPGKQRLAASIDVMQAMVDRVGDVANSILRLGDPVNREALFRALLELQQELFLTDAQVSRLFDIMVEHDKIALGFLARPIEHRKVWLANFVTEHL